MIGSININLASGERLSRKHLNDLEIVFDLLPDIYFYVKDQSGRWVTCNSASLRLLSLSDRSEIVGAREEDFFPKPVARSIRLDDLQILRTGRRIIDRVELIASEKGQLVWAKTSKIPVYDQQGAICGLVGLTHQVQEGAPLPGAYERFRGVIRHIDEHLAEPIRMETLASMASVSESHFRKVFKKRFGIAPQDFILRQRLRTAAHLLSSTGRPIAEIALDCGFSSQSYFSRHFTRFFSETPHRYRMRWRSG